MAQKTQKDAPPQGDQEMAQIMANIVERSQRLVSDFIARNASVEAPDMSESAHISDAFM